MSSGQSDWNDALIAFGSNAGDSKLLFDEVKNRLAEQFELVASSQPVETLPVQGRSGESQNAYLNAAFRIRTTLSALELMKSLLQLEQFHGRVREKRWASRTVDLDLLLFEKQMIDHADLVCPHPRMSFRRFVLDPATQVAADMVHMPSGLTVSELLDRINDRPNLIVWVGSEDVLKGCPDSTPLGNSISTSIDSSEDSPKDIPASKNEFHICYAPSTSDFSKLAETAKLVIVFDSTNQDNPELWDQAVSFSGAVLRIKVDNEWQDEVVAAVDAMS